MQATAEWESPRVTWGDYHQDGRNRPRLHSYSPCEWPQRNRREVLAARTSAVRALAAHRSSRRLVISVCRCRRDWRPEKKPKSWPRGVATPGGGGLDTTQSYADRAVAELLGASLALDAAVKAMK